MKKQIAIIFITLLVISLFILHIQSSLNQASGLGMTIPKHSIRLRILANSDSAADQEVKREIRDVVNADVSTWVRNLKNYKQARIVITSHLNEINHVVQQKLNEKGLKESFSVKLGPAKFPTKLYGGFVYPAGTYQALVVTLGSGTGANWWCVLFPPLCFLDFEHGDAVKPQDNTVTDSSQEAKALAQDKKQKESQKPEDQVQVKFFVVDLFHEVVDKVNQWL